MDDLMDHFHGLTDTEDRLNMLHRLVSTLDAEERKALLAMIFERHDRLWTLPLELVIDIFTYLPMSDAWRLQVVSRRWQSMLSSPRFLRAVLARWETHDPADSARPVEALCRDPIENRVRHMQAMRLGRPFTTAVYHDELGPPERSQGHKLRSIDLKGCNLAHIRDKATDGDDIAVRDLISGEVNFVHGNARERIVGLVLTDALIAFVTFSGLLYVNRLPVVEGAVQQMRLPSSQVIDLVGNGRHIALLLKSQNAGCGTLVLYSDVMRQLKAHQFPLQRANSEHCNDLLPPRNLLLDSTANSIRVFSCDYLRVRFNNAPYESYQLVVGCLRFRLGCGEVLESDKHALICFEPSVVRSTVVGNQLHSIGRDDEVRICIDTRLDRRHGRGTTYRPCAIPYHTKSERFSPQHDSTCGEEQYTFSEARFWKDNAYKSGWFPNFQTYLWEDEPPEPQFKPQGNLEIIRVGRFPRHAPAPFSFELKRGDNLHFSRGFMINDTFLVCETEALVDKLMKRIVVVFCFDEEVQLFNGHNTGLWNGGGAFISDRSNIYQVNDTRHKALCVMTIDSRELAKVVLPDKHRVTETSGT